MSKATYYRCDQSAEVIGTYAMTITTTFTFTRRYLLTKPHPRLIWQVLGTNAMIMTDNNYPNTAKVVSSQQ